MSSRTLDACLLTLVLVVASCTQAPHGPDLDAAPVAAEPDPDLDEPAEDVPPATVPYAARTLAAKPAAARFATAVPVPFGADAGALRAAWQGELAGVPGEDLQACHYLFPQPRPAQGHGRAFMFEGARLVRMDVDDPLAVAPGGARIGMDAAEAAALYPGRVEEVPHKYVEGAKYLRVTEAGSDVVLLLETDAEGAIRSWRVGVPPQVDYVEGCG